MVAAGPALEPYPDGRWWVGEHRTSERFPLCCRGNVGEVYPNVGFPLTASIVDVPFCRGAVRASRELGFATPGQLAEFDGEVTAMIGNHAGYLFANVSLIRSIAMRTPGLTVDDVDRLLFGLNDAPPYVAGPGDRNVVALARTVAMITAAILRPSDNRVTRDAGAVHAWLDATSGVTTDPSAATDAELLGVARCDAGLLERLMADLIRVGAVAGMARTMLDDLVRRHGPASDDAEANDLVNRLTAGLGTIESAEPAAELWRLGRAVASDPDLGALFDDGVEGLEGRLRGSPSPAVVAFVEGFDAFRARFGYRGPDELELSSPTWGAEPGIALAAIDRLRHAPGDRDPVAATARLASGRSALARYLRPALPRRHRRRFDLALRAAGLYSAQREATKASLVLALAPARTALAELARRSPFEHRDLFLLRLDEVPRALEQPGEWADVVSERRTRRDYLQARVPPFWFEGTIPPPPTWRLRVDDAIADGTPRTLTGLGVCPGTATGTARVVHDPAAPGALAEGDVLIAPFTDPAWTPLFLAVAAVVVDVGAQLSHAAIVARELGIPAVVSVTGATATIPDGATVTVDGSAGRVTVHPG